MKRLLRILTYWLRYLAWPWSMRWTKRDTRDYDYEVEWHRWEADDYRGFDGDV
jgi:hypothetical protein